ncbi:PREDICTED: alpha-protein kinase 3 [Chrysochloris asiatica]|uniref:non-specific serine/threonine protein kinase n=1 Tax=Chrysochloris asiatica TaxID=185453 RepID=A0A9B0X2Z8_CHRAS|nr:PREDICTED: alpha-protein kinase 3 [Chrysochloris asiatica]
MVSRRVLSREWGTGLRSGAGDNGEDDGPVWTPSPTSRSYLLSVRPETSLSSSRLSHPSSGRSTFCSIIAQLTEETQPLFETTLKSRAVSEDSDVLFTCIVTAGLRNQALESQATMVLITPDSSSSDVVSLGSSTSTTQATIEPMDTETQEDGRTFADRRTGGNKNAQADGKMQVEGRMLTDGQTQGDRTQTTLRTQAERKTQVDVGSQESVRRQVGRSSQEDVVTKSRAGAQAERTQACEKMQENRKTQADERTQEDRRIQGEKGPQSEGSIPTTLEGQSEEKLMSSRSPQSRAPASPPSEGPRPPQITRHFEQTQERSSVPEKTGLVLSSEETAVTASRNHEETVLGPLPGSLPLPAQLPPEGSLEPMGGKRCPGPRWSSPAQPKLKSSLSHCPTEDQPGEVLSVDLSSCPPTGLSPEMPSTPSLPGNSLTSSPLEGLPSTLTSQHTSTATSLPSEAQGLFGSPPIPYGNLHPATPTQGHPPETMTANSEGACSKVSDGEGRLPGPQSCDPGLIDSLKNYLLLLLKLSGTEASGGVAEPQASSSSLVPTMEVAGLSPRTSRRILERVENNHLVQSAQTLLLSPCTSRRLTGLLDREVQAGQQALAAVQASQSPSPSPLTVPSIVVGEEGPGPVSEEGSNKGERATMESSVSGSTGEAGGLAGAGQQLLSAESRVQESFQEEEFSGEVLTDLPAATPEELALGARRKRFLPKARAGGEGEAAKPEERESPTISPRGSRKGLVPGSSGTPGRERRSPTQGRKTGLLEVPKMEEEPAAGDPDTCTKAGGLDVEPALDEGKQDAPAKPKKDKNLLKAPQVIRKIRVEQFPDASGSLKLWCQFFNILSDSVLTWAKDQRPVGEVGRSAGDEEPAALAIVQASPVDCGMYRCTIHNEHGSTSTDFCLSPEVLSGFISREEGEVGEEIEMTPMVFAKGLADSGCWGDKLFGRLVSEELRGGGRGCGLQKASQAKVIYGLEPIFESGRTCIIKVSSLLVFGPSSETSLLGRNYDVTIQGCKIQNMSREYCKIFGAEARAVPGFGDVPEIIPLYLIYRPANNIPYATLEEDLGKPLESYCSREWGSPGAPEASTSSEVMQKCHTFQHWLYQWTNGSFLVTDLAGIDWKMTDVQIATKLRGYQGLKESCFPALLDQFVSMHQCNAYCEMLGLKALKGPEAVQAQAKAKGSKSPSSGRKGAQLSPQPQKKGLHSPQGNRKSAPSSKATAQASEAVTTRLLGQSATQEGGSKAQGMR